MSKTKPVLGSGMEELAKQLLADYVLQHKKLMQEINEDEEMPAKLKVDLLSKMAVSFNKTIMASKRVLPELDELATILETLKCLSEFTQARFPQHQAVLLEILDPFGAELLKGRGL